MQAADRLDDGRAHRRDITGWATGALCCAVLGALLGALLPGLSTLAGAVLGGVLGAVAGGILGLKLARQIDPEEFDPERSERPYVGAQAPDTDADHPARAAPAG